MRMIGWRRVVGGSVAAIVAAGGVFGVLAASSGATRSVANPAAGRLGSVTALAGGVQMPVGARLVLRPSVSFNLPPGELRMLRATKPRLSGFFRARIVTAPVRGRSRTLAVVSRRVSGLALRASARHSILGGRLQLRQWVLSRKETRAVKRAAARGALALAFSARYRVSYIKARGRRVMTPTRSGSVSLSFALKRQQALGGNLRNLASTFRALLGRVGQLKVQAGGLVLFPVEGKPPGCAARAEHPSMPGCRAGDHHIGHDRVTRQRRRAADA